MILLTAVTIQFSIRENGILDCRRGYFDYSKKKFAQGMHYPQNSFDSRIEFRPRMISSIDIFLLRPMCSVVHLALNPDILSHFYLTASLAAQLSIVFFPSSESMYC